MNVLMTILKAGDKEITTKDELKMKWEHLFIPTPVTKIQLKARIIPKNL